MSFKERAKDLVSKMTLAEKVSQMQHEAPAISRLNIPAYNWWNECLHGVGRAGCATVFPQAIGMAASFNPDLLFEVATAISDEARAKYNEFKIFGYTQIYQGLTFWSPNINIFRDPRWGRGHETYGEDPYLTGCMGSAFINGLQGNNEHYRKIDATIKHYAVHSGPEKGRSGFNAVVNNKDLYETYLYAFTYCIEHANPSAVMGSYNRINGEPACASQTYLKKLLYQELGFDGYVVSDCGAICNINKFHKITNNEAESAALAVNNGCQLNCGRAYKHLKTAVALGLISEETITEAVERLFTARFRLGMFDDCVYDSIPYEVVECEKHQELNRKMAQESIVLLKNNGILPITNKCNIAVIGPNADTKTVLLGNYNGTPSTYTTLLKGIQDAASGKVTYARGCHLFDDESGEWAEKPMHEAIIAAQKSDIVILCMGLDSTLEGEEGDAFNGDLGGDKADLELPLVQKHLLDAIIATNKPIVFVNVSGSCVNLEKADKSCDAVIQSFYPGAQGGSALADILFGKVSPSGKLPVTFYSTTDDLPSFEDYSMKNRTYRYYKGKPLYPFGFGLSYTDFTYQLCSKKTMDVHENQDITISVNVKNIGHMDGAETVQIFLKPCDGMQDQPIHKLIAFKKIFLEAGLEREVLLTVSSSDLCWFNTQGRPEYSKGTYQLFVGGGQPGFSDTIAIQLNLL